MCPSKLHLYKAKQKYRNQAHKLRGVAGINDLCSTHNPSSRLERLLKLRKTKTSAHLI